MVICIFPGICLDFFGSHGIQFNSNAYMYVHIRMYLYFGTSLSLPFLSTWLRLSKLASMKVIRVEGHLKPYYAVI